MVSVLHLRFCIIGFSQVLPALLVMPALLLSSLHFSCPAGTSCPPRKLAAVLLSGFSHFSPLGSFYDLLLRSFSTSQIQLCSSLSFHAFSCISRYGAAFSRPGARFLPYMRLAWKLDRVGPFDNRPCTD